jgi:uncharacterized protein with HEPN domain
MSSDRVAQRLQDIIENIDAILDYVLRHPYDDIDPRYIFTTIQRDLPGLREACAVGLKEAS